MGRTPCCKEDGLKKGAWTADEDRKLTAYIREHGEGGWRTLPQKAGLQRCGKSCRLRWANYLRPDIKRGHFSSEEEQKIIELHATLGSRWSAIARHLPMRTDNEIKNYWNTYIKKRLTKMGVDPVTHKPIDPSVDNTHEHDSNNLATSPAPRCDDDEIAARPPTPSGPPSAGSARLLNRLATKLALSRCLDNFNSCQSRHDKDVTDHKESTSVAAPGGVACDADQHLLTIPRPVSSSARLLNKIASRVTTTSFHSLDSILSKSIEGGDSYGPGRCGGGGFDGDSRSNNYCTPRSTSTSSLSESTGAASDLSRSISYSSGAPEETMAKHLAPLDDDDNDDDPFDLELLKHWEGVLTGSIDDADTDVIGCCSDGGVSSTATGDTYNIDSPMYPLKSSTASGYDSRELSDLLRSCLDGS